MESIKAWLCLISWNKQLQGIPCLGLVIAHVGSCMCAAVRSSLHAHTNTQASAVYSDIAYICFYSAVISTMQCILLILFYTCRIYKRIPKNRYRQAENFFLNIICMLNVNTGDYCILICYYHIHLRKTNKIWGKNLIKWTDKNTEISTPTYTHTFNWHVMSWPSI